MQRAISVHPLEDYRLSITFDDGTQGEVALRERLFGPVFEPLRDPAVFRQVFVDDFGAIAWPNGADLAPDALYERLRVPAESAS
ncbi:MAG: DUF2442 domain-containing protein [Planctomycetes bacterium]|nr:DUF2442 domain-containing protein [Planctomycetota bacterium]